MLLRKHIGPLTIYVACVLAAFCIAALQSGAQTGQVAVAGGPGGMAKPYFSLCTNRTYGARDRARVRIGYVGLDRLEFRVDRKSTRLKSSHVSISYAVFCLQK